MRCAYCTLRYYDTNKNVRGTTVCPYIKKMIMTLNILLKYFNYFTLAKFHLV